MLLLPQQLLLRLRLPQALPQLPPLKTRENLTASKNTNGSKAHRKEKKRKEERTAKVNQAMRIVEDNSRASPKALQAPRTKSDPLESARNVLENQRRRFKKRRKTKGPKTDK
jgi:hypothetical protein